MNRNDIIRLTEKFLVEDFEIDADLLKDENALLKEDIGLDSLDFVDIVVIVEKTFGFKPNPTELGKQKTLADFYSYIEQNV